MFALINVGERSGTGICDVYHVWDENGFKKPSFVETVDPDRVVLTLQIETDGNPDGNDGYLTQNEMLVLQVITQNPGLSAAKIGSQIGISKPSVERVLRSLKDKGRIRREGSTRGKWIIIHRLCPQKAGYGRQERSEACLQHSPAAIHMWQTIPDCHETLAMTAGKWADWNPGYGIRSGQAGNRR